MRVYVAGPLFTPDARARLHGLADVIRGAGHTPLMPFPEDAAWPGAEDPDARRAAFEQCLAGVRGADALVAVLDGADADAGTAFEVGVAHARGIPVLGVRSDYRTLGPEGAVNLMLHEGVTALSRHADDWDAIARDVRAFLADPPPARGTRLLRDREPALAREAGRALAVRKVEGAEYAAHLKRAIVAAAERLAAADADDEKTDLADVLEGVEALIAHRAYARDTLRHVKVKREEALGGYRIGYVTEG